ncbi:unnamed protein product [Polarella glacialis]|uniref:Roc domain-containing protein n=1 Tax=Polarella glacialis TaxID=89957 RepID=A0A813LLI9_POLGL|nr:unnamed protein product [Polarella glacialis]
MQNTMQYIWKPSTVVAIQTRVQESRGGELRIKLGQADAEEKEMEGETADGWARKVRAQVARHAYQLEVTPDYARNSNFSKRQAFSVQVPGDELLLLSAPCAEQMWRWCKALWKRSPGQVAREQAEALGSALNKLCQQKNATKAGVQELLLLGAEVDWRDWRGGTALMRAARSIEGVARAQVVALLLSAGADVNAVDRCGATTLLSLCLPPHDPTRPALVEILLQKGAAVHAMDETMGNLMTCLIRGDTEKSGTTSEDRGLARRFIEMGLGRENNTKGEQKSAEVLSSQPAAFQLKQCAKPRRGTWMHKHASLTVNDGMTKVSTVILQMPWLVSLDLSENTILSLPSQLFDQLLNLEELDLSFNCLIALPHNVGKCQKMKTLRLVGNRLAELPAEIGKIEMLEELELGTFQSVFGNPILEPPPEVWQRRGQVQPFQSWGVVDQRQISRSGLGFPKREARDEPKQSTDPAKTESVDASAAADDMKRNAPSGHFDIKHSDVNSIHHPAITVFEEDHTLCGESSSSHVQRVRRHLLATLLGGSVENWTLTLPVMGLSEAGKTSLINSMVEGVSRLMRVGDRTVGVEQRQWGMPVQVQGADKTIDLRIFDFAGQAEYLFTHHMFLTANGLCVVAFDLHKYRPHHLQRMVVSFLEALQSRVPGAVVLLVGTHADMVSEELQSERCQQVLQVLQRRQGRERRQLHAKMQRVAEAKQALVEKEMRRIRIERGELDPDDPASRHDFAEQIEYLHLMKQVMAPTHQGGVIAGELGAMDVEYEQLRCQVARLVKLPEKAHAVSSLTMQGVAALIEDIKLTAINREKFPRMGQSIPRIYTQVRDCVREWKVEMPFCEKRQLVSRVLEELENGETWLEGAQGHETLPEGRQIFEAGAGAGAATLQQGGSNERARIVEDALSFYHELGELASYSDHDGLADIVFLSLPWVVDVLKHLVRHDHSDSLVYGETVMDCGFDREDPDQQIPEPVLAMTSIQFQRAKKDFLNHGCLSLLLLRYFWRSIFPLGMIHSIFRKLVSILCYFDVAIPSHHDNYSFSTCASIKAATDTELLSSSSAATSTDTPPIALRLLVPAFFPSHLPLSSWPLLCDSPTASEANPLAGKAQGNAVQVWRWLALSDAVPTGLMPSLQARLHAHSHFQPEGEQRSHFIFAKEGVVVISKSYRLLVRLSHGSQTGEGEGVQVIGRTVVPAGEAGDAEPWAAVAEVVACVQGLLRQWQGIASTLFVQWETQGGGMASWRMADLQQAREKGDQVVMCRAQALAGTASDGVEEQLGLERLLGLPSVAAQAPAAVPTTVLNCPLEVRTGISKAECDTCGHLTQLMRKHGIRWAMLSYAQGCSASNSCDMGTADSASQHQSGKNEILAEGIANTSKACVPDLVSRVYRELLRRGFPVWLDVVGGIYGSRSDAICDGVEGAAVVVPFVAEAYFRTGHCMKEIAYAHALNKPVVPVLVEPGFRIRGDSQSSTAPTLNLKASSVTITPEVSDDELKLRVDDLEKELLEQGVEALSLSLLSQFDSGIGSCRRAWRHGGQLR